MSPHTLTAQVLTGLQIDSLDEGKRSKCRSDLSSSVLVISSVLGGSVGSMFFLSGYQARRHRGPSGDKHPSGKEMVARSLLHQRRLLLIKLQQLIQLPSVIADPKIESHMLLSVHLIRVCIGNG
jgi:hypothetical protein